MKKMKIEVWSDIACPYCYIGKRKLEKALAQFPHSDNVELVWHSYELNPDLPKIPLNKSYSEYLKDIYDLSEAETKENNEKVISLAKEVGLNYDLDSVSVVNTSDALRLVKLAGQYNLADELEERLFDAYFIKGENVADPNFLLQLGTEAGLPKDRLLTVLAGEEFLSEVKKDVEYSENELGLEYIPFYLFNNKHIIQGSMAIENYLDILKKSYEEWKEKGSSLGDERENISFGGSCSIDGVCG